VGGKNVFLGGASQGWVEFSRRKFPLDDRVSWAGCGTALHAALTYEGELGGVIGYLAKMRLIVTRRTIFIYTLYSLVVFTWQEDKRTKIEA